MTDNVSPSDPSCRSRCASNPARTPVSRSSLRMTTGSDSGAAWPLPFFFLDSVAGAGDTEAPSSAAAMAAADATAAVGGAGTAEEDAAEAVDGETAWPAASASGTAIGIASVVHTRGRVRTVLVGPAKTEGPRHSSAGCRHSSDGGGTGGEGERVGGKNTAWLAKGTARDTSLPCWRRRESRGQGQGISVRKSVAPLESTSRSIGQLPVVQWGLRDGRRTDGWRVPDAENFSSSRVLQMPLEVRKSPPSF